jgi:erythromycin esterase
VFFKTIIISLLFFSTVVLAQEKQLGTVISNLDLTKFHFDSLNYTFQDSKVIGVGESTHGTHEFSVLRIALFKHLVQKYDFNTFFMEASYSSCLRVDNYIKGNEDDLYDIMVNLKLWPWQTTEMMTLIEWMKEYNTKNLDKDLSFVGIDMRYNYESTVEELKELNPKLKSNNLNWDSIPLSQKRLQIESIKSFVFNTSDSATNFKYQFLITQLDQFYKGELTKRPKYYRDIKMGRNIIAYLDYYPNAKGLYWAHNGHIKKTWTGFIKKEGRAGGYLNSKLGSEYLALAQDFKIGAFNVFRPDSTSEIKINDIGYSFGTISFGDFSENSLVASLSLDSLPIFYSKKDIRKANSGQFILINAIGAKYTPRKYSKEAGANYSRYKYHKIKEFDGIIYIPKSTPTKMIHRRK